MGGDPYSFDVKAPAKSKVGEAATTELVVTPGAGWKINVDYPSKLTLSKVPDGAKVASATITKAGMQIDKTRLTVPVSFTSEAPGGKSFEGELRFSVCNEISCQMPREKVAWTTQVEAAQ